MKCAKKAIALIERCVRGARIGAQRGFSLPPPDKNRANFGGLRRQSQNLSAAVGSIVAIRRSVTPHTIGAAKKRAGGPIWRHT